MSADAVGPGTIIEGRYELISLLGSGGFGVVYKAKQLTTGQLVAIKIARSLDEKTGSGIAARFRREMEVVAELSHPNIVRLFDTGQLPDKRLFAVLQLVRGVSLSELLRKEGPLDPTEAKHLMTQVIDALCSAHDVGVIHRDLKPANIMVTHVGALRNALVLDFGIATFTKGMRDDSYQSLTPDGSVGGTPAYMAPEQLHGKLPNPQTDIYAWGLVFLESLTGQRVVRGNTIAETMFTHLRPDPHPLPPSVAAHPLGRILRSSLAKDARSRYANARDALSQLTPCDVSALRRLPRSETPGVSPDGDTAMQPTADPDAPEMIEVISRSGKARAATSDPVDTIENPARTPRTPRGRRSDITSPSTTQKLVAERRQLTAMVCELGPMSQLSEQVELDELYEIMARFRRMSESVVARLEGVVDRCEGGRIVSYFGYPLAHEDDASRAVQAALEIIARVSDGTLQIPTMHGSPAAEIAHDITLNVHVGLHTGLVVTSNLHLAKTGEVSIVGDVARVAVRLQENADTGEILMTDEVYQLVGDRFECERRGSRKLGMQGSFELYHVIGISDAVSAFKQAEDRPAIGRQSELDSLIERWEEVSDGRGQVVLLSGEAGIGKSHLTSVFRHNIRDDQMFWLDCASSPYLPGSAFHPVIHALRVLLGFERGDSPTDKRARVNGFLETHELSQDRFEEFLIALLELDEPPTGDAGVVFRQPVEEQLIDFVFALADIRPVVVCLEDLHWSDPSTHEFTHLLIDQAPLGAILALATTRPTYLPDWRNRSHVTRMPLSRLSRKRVETMVRSVVGHKQLPKALVKHLVSKTDGVPLFVEELTKAVIESEAVIEHDDRYELSGELSSQAIPATLRGSLMARLDRLGSAKEVAQIAAIIGREFSFGLIEAISDIPAEELSRALSQLVHSELIIQRGRPPNAKYIFKHALVQDTAYESLLDKTRRRYHAAIADALEVAFTEVAQSQPELLARHYTEARLLDKAVTYWLRAGEWASQRSAHQEGIQHLKRGLRLVERMAEGTERDKLELTLLMKLGPPLMSTQGYGSSEVEPNYSRAAELCRKLQDEHDLLPVLWGLWAFCQVRADYKHALEYGEQLVKLAERIGDPERYLSAHQAYGSTLLITGSYDRARSHFARGIELYDPVAHRDMAFSYGQDPGMYCHVFLSWALFAQGFPDQALAHADKSIELARNVEHPNSLAFAMCMFLPVLEARGDYARLRAMSDEAIELCSEYRLMHWLAFAKFMNGLAHASQSVVDQGIAEMRRALTEWRARAQTTLPYFYSKLAERMGYAGDVQEGLDLQSQVPAAGYDHLGRHYEPTWKLVRSRLLVLRDQPGDKQGAELILLETAASSRDRGDRMTELASLTALIELRRTQDQPYAQDRARLAELHGSITEGVDIPVMRAAAKILAETA